MPNCHSYLRLFALLEWSFFSLQSFRNEVAANLKFEDFSNHRKKLLDCRV
jgi:hypothetical protein